MKFLKKNIEMELFVQNINPILEEQCLPIFELKPVNPYYSAAYYAECGEFKVSFMPIWIEGGAGPRVDKYAYRVHAILGHRNCLMRQDMDFTSITDLINWCCYRVMENETNEFFEKVV
jgi:hypothetical protein